MRACLYAVTLTVVFWAHGVALAAPPPIQTEFVPMSDGVKLATDVHLPDSAGGPWPVILARSTYGRVGGPVDALLQLGIAVVAQDVRGMGASEGEKYVFNADGWRPGLTDGAETVAWILAQPWCNGKIGTWGGSALGITQMLLAPTTRGVAAQFIEVAPSNLYEDMFYQGGVFRKCLLEGWLPQIGQPHLLDVYKSHPRYDCFWWYYDAELRAPDMTAPAMFVGGWYDIFNQGTIDAFVSRESNGGEGAKGQNYLIMKWSAHLETQTPDYKLQDDRWSFDVNRFMAAFYAAHLLGQPDALKEYAKVNYYVMGADTPGAPGNEWRTASTWPPFDAEPARFYLRPDGALNTEASSETKKGSRSFSFDPKNPVPTHGGANLTIPAGPMDQRANHANRQDVLAFSTEPLTKPMEITGRVSVRLFVSTDAPDTDFTAMLLDVYPSGDDREVLMLDGIRRVKTRFGFNQVAPPLEGEAEIVEIIIDLQSTSWIFDKGHRIGLHVSSSNFPRFEVNPNTGADFPTPGGEMRVAHNTVHMDKAHPSALILPVRSE
ncbi:MAG: CocE/NonD family hydrolase [Candidatus Hydrogenedentes bacterium]|nr:CocE/NonD family hydrolase [Candidatus Hydrogenedentota bacterium]